MFSLKTLSGASGTMYQGWHEVSGVHVCTVIAIVVNC